MSDDEKSDLDKVRDVLNFSWEQRQVAVKAFNKMYSDSSRMDLKDALLMSINTQLGALCAVAEYVVEGGLAAKPHGSCSAYFSDASTELNGPENPNTWCRHDSGHDGLHRDYYGHRWSML